MCNSISTSHKAVVVSSSHIIINDLRKAKSRHQYRTRRPNQHASLLSYGSYRKDLSWKAVLKARDVQQAFDKEFFEIASQILNCFYLLHVITVTNRDPHFVTRYIKALLRKRNTLMRKGRVDAAESLSARIGQSITSLNKRAFLKFQRGSQRNVESRTISN